jgi:putative oxidoreductase
MLKKFFSTDETSWSLLIARVALGLVILPHGMQKALGMFGGFGFGPTIDYFGQIGITSFIGTLVILAEFVGSIGLILGFATRFMAFSITLTMTGAVILGGHLQHGFFMNWFGNQAGEGYEFFIAVIALGFISMLSGAGRFAFDNLFSRILNIKH